MAIELLGKDKAKLIYSQGSGTNKKRYSKTVTFNGKKDLNEQYLIFKTIHEGLKKDSTIAQLLNVYLQHLEAQGVKQTTLRGYSIAAKAIKKDLGAMKVSQLTRAKLQRWVECLTQSGKKPKTIKNWLSFLSGAIKREILLGHLKNNPVEGVIIPTQHKTEATILEPELLSKFLFISKNYNTSGDFYLAVLLATFLGLRRSEILGLKKEDFNLADKTITIRRTRHAINGEDIIQTPKTISSVRTLALPDFISAEMIRVIAKNSFSEFIILYDKKPMQPRYLSNAIENIRRRYPEFGKITFHGLRHTAASNLIAEGVSIADVSKMLGHSTITTTLNIYTHAFNNSSQVIAKKIQENYEKKRGKEEK